MLARQGLLALRVLQVRQGPLALLVPLVLLAHRAQLAHRESRASRVTPDLPELRVPSAILARKVALETPDPQVLRAYRVRLGLLVQLALRVRQGTQALRARKVFRVKLAPQELPAQSVTPVPRVWQETRDRLDPRANRAFRVRQVLRGQLAILAPQVHRVTLVPLVRMVPL